MALAPGTRIGPYEVTALIGEGGMGQVYRGRDTRLNRDVALKILPEAFARDPDRRARFEREAQLLASLNHPHIGSIYGVEEGTAVNDSSPSALVLELVEGPTLADRIAQGPMPLDEALPVARQMAEALEAAHARGIVHRDLKPANIKLRADGTVKVLDFGLAKALEPGPPAGMSVAATIASPAHLTGVGALLGTAAYMSPEQARGRDVDKRSDIWAFGCVLFEMLSGRRLFDGESGQDMLARVIEREPDFTVLPSGMPPSIMRLLRRALVKDRQSRLPDIGVARMEIADAASGQDEADAISPQPPRWRRVLPWALAIVTAVGAVLAFWAGQRPVDPGARIMRFTENLPPGVSFYTGSSLSLAVSRDGTHLAYIGIAGGERALYIRQVGETGTTSIPAASFGSGALMSCFFSWDGTAVGFITVEGMLGKVTIGDKRVVVLQPSNVQRRGATWGPDHRITFVRGGTLWQIPDAGRAEPKQLTTIDHDNQELFHGWPTAVGTGDRILFTVMTSKPRDPASIWVLSGSPAKRKVIEEAGVFPMYAESGHLLFFRDGSLLARAFDLEHLSATPSAFRVLDNLGTDAVGMPLVALAADGTLIYAHPVDNRIVWVSREGTLEEQVSVSRAHEFPRLMPDGSRLIASVRGELLFENLGTHFVQRLDPSEPLKNFPVIAPTGKRVVYRTATGLRVLDLDRPNAVAEAIPGTGYFDYPTSISSDETLAFLRTDSGAGDIYFVSLRDHEQPRAAVLNTASYDGGLRFSPDDRLVAFVSNEADHMEVYVAPRSNLAAKKPVSAPHGGTQPVWARRSKGSVRELFYRNNKNEMRVANISMVGDVISVSEDRPLFERVYQFGSGLTNANYDVDLDDRRFLMVKDDGESGRLNVVLNWFSELASLVPPAGR